MCTVLLRSRLDTDMMLFPWPVGSSLLAKAISSWWEQSQSNIAKGGVENCGHLDSLTQYKRKTMRCLWHLQFLNTPWSRHLLSLPPSGNRITFYLKKLFLSLLVTWFEWGWSYLSATETSVKGNWPKGAVQVSTFLCRDWSWNIHIWYPLGTQFIFSEMFFPHCY